MLIEKSLKNINEIILKKRFKNLKEVFHLYEFRVKNKKIRKNLVNHLLKNGIDAKIHYPVPMHLQQPRNNMAIVLEIFQFVKI